jgi:hypothetical protein
MILMFRSCNFRLGVLAVGFALAAFVLIPGAQGREKNQHGRKYKPPPPIAHIEVDVVRARDGKPIPNAAVIFHPLEGERDRGALELKTNEEGKAIVEVLAIGDRVRLQVIAQGFQTYGGDCSINKSSMTFGVRLNRPEEQYSIYLPHGDTSNNGQGNCGEIVINPAPAAAGGAAATNSFSSSAAASLYVRSDNAASASCTTPLRDTPATSAYGSLARLRVSPAPATSDRRSAASPWPAAPASLATTHPIAAIDTDNSIPRSQVARTPGARWLHTACAAG